MDDTLSPQRFHHPTVKTQLAAQERYALRQMLEKRHQAGQKCSGWGLVRELLLDALELTEWTLDRRIEEYAAYSVECVRTGKHNEFESE